MVLTDTQLKELQDLIDEGDNLDLNGQARRNQLLNELNLPPPQPNQSIQPENTREEEEEVSSLSRRPESETPETPGKIQKERKRIIEKVFINKGLFNNLSPPQQEAVDIIRKSKNEKETIEKYKELLFFNNGKTSKRVLDELRKTEKEPEDLNEIKELFDHMEKETLTKQRQQEEEETKEEKPSKAVLPKQSNQAAEGTPAGAPSVQTPLKKEKPVKEPPKKRGLPDQIYPSTSIVLAKKFSGKTNLLLNIVNPDKFDNIWIVSFTGFTGKLDKLCKDENCLLENINDEMINELLKLHKESSMNSLIVFDDIIGQIRMDSRAMVKLATMGRNFGISIIISSQDYFRVPPVWRRNSEYWFIGALTDSNIDAASKELSNPTFQKNRIKSELNIIARDKQFDWLFYDDRKTDFRKVFGNELKVFV